MAQRSADSLSPLPMRGPLVFADTEDDCGAMSVTVKRYVARKTILKTTSAIHSNISFYTCNSSTQEVEAGRSGSLEGSLSYIWSLSTKQSESMSQ